MNGTDDTNELDGLDDLRQMRSEISGPTPEALGAARAALHEQMATPVVADLARHRSEWTALRSQAPLLSRTLHSPTARRVASSVVGVAAVAGTVFALTGGSADSGKPSPQAGGKTSTSTSTSVSLPPAPAAVIHYVNASQVLNTASAKALSTPGLEPGQYTYSREHQLHITQNGEPPSNGSYEFIEDLDKTWTPSEVTSPAFKHADDAISVHYPTAQQRRYDETTDGAPQRDTGWYAVDALGNETPLAMSGAAQATCSNCADFSNPLDYATRANLVHLTDNPVQLRKDLFAYAQAQNKEATQYGKSTLVNSIALHSLNDLLTFPSLTVAQRAALFDVAKTIPGIKITGSMANYDGVRGTGIGLTNTLGITESLIFSSTGDYLGEKEVLTGGPTVQYELPKGTVLAWSAQSFATTGKPELPHS